MTLTAVVLTLLVGCGVGLASGLLGIGGGMLIVPFLYLLFSQPAWSGVDPGADHVAVMAHATSLGVILPTALSGLREYRRSGLLDLGIILPIGLGAAVFAALGALVASYLPAPVLKASFGLLLVVTALRLLKREVPTAGGDGGPGRWGPLAMGLAGGVVGFLSALLGIGGGAVAIPVLLFGARLPVNRVAAASLGVVLFAAVAGVVSYALLGMGAPGLPPGSWGYLFLPAMLAMIPGAVLCAPLGARLNQRVDADRLRLVFALLLLLLGARLVWANLPEALA